MKKRWTARSASSLCSALLALSLTLSGQTLAQQQQPLVRTPWPEAPFSYYAEKSQLRSVLDDFSKAFNLTLQTNAVLSDVVNGRFNARNPTEFIDRLAGTYGLTWFTYAGGLYVARSNDREVRTIYAPSLVSGGNLRQVLTNMGLLDARFGWSELVDQGAVVVSGPPAYVQLVAASVAGLPSAPIGQQVAVFRLKHASVEDRVIAYRDREITTPGIANILRNLVLGTTSASGSRTVLNPQLQATNAAAQDSGQAQGLGVGAMQGIPKNASSEPTGNIAGQARFKPSIQSEPRINAVIVQDSPDRMPMYQRLIADLDVPTPLIEIEAMIIDVNSSRISELGISWSSVSRDQSRAIGFGNLSSTPTNGTLSIGGSTRGSGIQPSSALINGADYFIAQLRLLEQQGDASIQARPSILTTENLGAVLDLSETSYIQTMSERVALVTPVTAGTTLRVTPRLVGEGEQQVVRLTVDIEDGQIVQASGTNSMPTVRRGVISTDASVRRDESLLIGGYNSLQTVKNVEKMPLLGDIPILRALFSNTSDTLQRRERLFLIRSTPASSTSSMATRAIPAIKLNTPPPEPVVTK